MLKTKTNVKMLIALGIVLLAVLVFNMNTVNAETDIISSMNRQEITMFNAKFEAYAGENQSGATVKSLIQVVTANNETSEYKVKVNKELSEITASEKYGVILQYDNEDRVNEVIIGQNIKYGGITIIDSNGEIKTAFPPQSGGGPGIINANGDYTNCLFAIAVENNYGQSFETKLGTFTHTTKYRDLGEMLLEQENVNVYTCPVKMSDISSLKYKLNLIFTATNVDTNKEEQVTANIDVFKSDYKANASLKVGDTNFVTNGKVVKGSISNEKGGFAAYNEITNILSLTNYTGKVVYSNMGISFQIEKDENSNIEIVCEDEAPSITILTNNKTNINLNADKGVLPNGTTLEAENIKEGTFYNTVTKILSNVKGFRLYDINLLSNGTKIQPNGKVKVSIPIPSDFDKTKLSVYRVSENGDKTEYKVTVEGDYATFETDHFSMYVLAEKTAETPTTPPSNTDDRKKDDTPKTGTIDVVGYLSIITLVSAMGIIVFRRKK